MREGALATASGTEPGCPSCAGARGRVQASVVIPELRTSAQGGKAGRSSRLPSSVVSFPPRLNVALVRGLSCDPAFGSAGAAAGRSLSSQAASLLPDAQSPLGLGVTPCLDAGALAVFRGRRAGLHVAEPLCFVLPACLPRASALRGGSCPRASALRGELRGLQVPPAARLTSCMHFARKPFSGQ